MFDFASNPKLLDRVLMSPHGYFRFINAPFSQAVCDRFRGASRGLPLVNLHGDAHLEQYAVTNIGRGLTDFDDSSRGPAILDLLRFGVSLHLGMTEHMPDLSCRTVFERFLDGYRAALEKPEQKSAEPKYVTGIRKAFSSDRESYFEWIDTLMHAVAPVLEDELKRSLQPYIKAMRVKHPELAKGFFRVKALGALKIGIGSALDEKYLVRIEGSTKDPLDDAVLEIKEVRTLTGINCIENTLATDPFRILLANSRIAYRPYAYLGYIDYRGKKFWIHSWVDNYREIKLKELVGRPEDLMELAYDVGVQLGRGHPKIAGEFEFQLRQAQLKFLNDYEPELHRALEVFGRATIEAWLRFKAAL